MWRIILGLYLLQIEAARPDGDLAGLMTLDQAEMKRVSDDIKNGNLDAAAASKIHIGLQDSQEREAEQEVPRPHPALLQDVAKGHAVKSRENALKKHKEKAKTKSGTRNMFFQDVAKSHEKLDHALKSYKDVADKEQQRATEVYEKLGAYKSSIAKLRSPLQQITSQVKELHTKMAKVLQADEKERLEPLNSLEAELGNGKT
ncbi:unnamed protein product [Durusdinium trenchii]|uniref:Uncharacterized protein n=1 Tax=Durusdinium trenchii TaxID=1381693 RepID=A0ABP0NHW4_9DINO